MKNLYLMFISAIICLGAKGQVIDSIQNEIKIIDNKKRSRIFNKVTKLNNGKFYEEIFEINSTDTVLLRAHFGIENDTMRILQGVAQSFFNRRLYTVVNYINNKREGFEIYYSSEGDIEKMIFYKNDKIDGSIITYYPNGNIKTIGKVFSAPELKYGEWKEYYRNGQLKEVRNYGLIDYKGEASNNNIITTPDSSTDYTFLISVKIGIWTKYNLEGKEVERREIKIPEW